ncbi:hypothetical protein DLD77_02455 [Chitinophaga alhagiae]|uniref:histidine kinase n=1 Tax=Chitinophaga alhagiae TaxID=2203219 RepID=A0ABN5LSF0_9BACT|nr:HAMP domain-containing sensor histidine kinase [Chitinophaga alhagiae]AWO00640.1 hypothetical protein DLD77_02455 [Chitinophaga alhagiae]
MGEQKRKMGWSDFLLGPGIIITLLLANSVVGARLMQGQGLNVVNLAGSQVVISLWCFCVWIATVLVVHSPLRNRLLQVLAVLLAAAACSVGGYYLSAFEDYPLDPLYNHHWPKALLRLTYRGALVGLIMYPIVYHLTGSRKVRQERETMEKQRQAMLEEKARQLEEEVAERTKELENVIVQLEQSEWELAESNKTKDRVITMVLHDLRTPLGFLQTVSKKLVNEHQQMDPASLGEQVEHLNNSILVLNEFTRQFFTWAVAQHAGFKVNIRKVAVQELFESIVELYSDIVKANNNTITLVPTDITCETDYDILSTILRNLADNAHKHMKNGRITLSASLAGEKLRITVTDTGSGLTASQQQAFVNDHDFNTAGGNGSSLVGNLLQKIGGELKIATGKEEGAAFTVVLALRPA